MNQKLEALELHGYKTFASKTLFVFPDKITAVVGPNGSGKSNIADSIRWVLGEQAYSLLRGKKTEDMIYSGSAQRSKMSMASATIRFNNSDGWLPIDYQEVNITRRAYRSGENEYLVNEKKVRLRDIQELLANSGLSERTYTIIGQGLVDSALSLKPQDRRLFFEEAAGIRLFRARREEAIKKLDKTVDNMARVKDILHEIRPRMLRLEKQVEKTKEYNRIDADLHLLLKDWYGYRWNNLQRDYRESQDAKNKKEIELNTIRMKVTDGDEGLTVKRKSLQEQREQLALLNNQLTELRSEKAGINRELAIIEERFKGYDEQRDSLRSSLAYAEEELKNRSEQKDDLEKQYLDQEQNLEKTKNELDTLEKSLNQKREEVKNIQASIDNCLQKKLDIDKAIAGDQAKNSDLENRLNILIKRRTELEASILTQEEKFQAISSDVERFQAFHDEKQTRLNEINETYQGLVEQKEKLEEDLRKVENDIQRNLNDISTKETQLNVLLSAKKNMEGFKTGTKKILNAFQQKRIQGKYELLLSCLRVQDGYEKAVAALLGDSAEGLVLDDSIGLNFILNMIHDAEESHSILIPKSLLREQKITQKQTIPGCRSILDFVQSTSEYQSIVQILFADTFILEDEKNLEDALKKLGQNQKIVLRDGGIFYGNGIISVGGTTSEFIFKREKEIDELHKEIQAIQRKGMDLQENRKKFSESKSELEAKVGELQNKRSALEVEANEIQRGLNEVREKQAEASQDIRLNKELIGKLVLDIQATIDDKNSLKLSIQGNQGKTEESQAEIDALKQKLQNITVEELNQDFYQKRTGYAVIQESFQSSKNRLQDSLRLIENLENQCHDLNQRLKNLEEQHVSLSEKYDQLSVRSENLNDQIKLLVEKADPIEKEITTSTEEIEGGQVIAEELRKNQSIIERHFIQLEMRVEKIKTQMDTLKERISDDFGLVSYEYEPDITGPKPLPIDGMVASLPKVTEIPDDFEEQIKTLKTAIRRIGSVNPEAEKEYIEEKERFEFLTSQIADLEQAEKDLRKVVVELEDIIKVKFTETFKAVNEEFSEIFKQLFGGGSAKLVIEDEENITETGIEIEATLPGKRKQELALLSGGERSLTAIALIFSLLKISPTPFCVLDEVDAMLDESNVVRLGQLMKDLSDRTQFIVITHNRNTVQLADVIYGVTMGRDSTSQLISLRLDEVTEDLVD